MGQIRQKNQLNVFDFQATSGLPSHGYSQNVVSHITSEYCWLCFAGFCNSVLQQLISHLAALYFLLVYVCTVSETTDTANPCSTHIIEDIFYNQGSIQFLLFEEKKVTSGSWHQVSYFSMKYFSNSVYILRSSAKHILINVS